MSNGLTTRTCHCLPHEIDQRSLAEVHEGVRKNRINRNSSGRLYSVRKAGHPPSNSGIQTARKSTAAASEQPLHRHQIERAVLRKEGVLFAAHSLVLLSFLGSIFFWYSALGPAGCSINICLWFEIMAGLGNFIYLTTSSEFSWLFWGLTSSLVCHVVLQGPQGCMTLQKRKG